MAKYVKAADSIITVVSPAGKEVKVTERAFSVYYSGQGYKRVGEVDERETLKKNNTADELKALLDEKEIEYPSSATKDELVDLIIGK